MTTNAKIITLTSVHSQPSWVSSTGPFQPPRNSTVVSADNTTIPAYSASRKKANRSPAYSVYGPKMTSLSATGMSNGGRRSSGRPAAENTTPPLACHGSHHHTRRAPKTPPPPSPCHGSHHHSQWSTIRDRLSEPAAIAAEEAARTIGSS